MKRIVTLLLCVIAFTVTLHAQEFNKGVKELVNEGEGHFEIDEFDMALKFLLQADKAQPGHPEISYLLGKTYIKIKRPDLAVKFLQIASDANYQEKTLNYELGQASHSVNKFDEAIAAYTKFKATLNEKKDKAKIDEVTRFIETCENGKELVKKPVNVKIKGFGKGINSKSGDYMPFVSADESVMIFTSRRPGSTGGLLDDHDSKYYEDIYYTERKDTVWGQVKNIGTTINTPSHDACVGISPNAQMMFVHVVNSKGKGDLFVSELKGKVWSRPKSLGPNINGTETNESGCSITPDGKILFFSSDRPGGEGGLDIWMSKKNSSGEWEVAVNLGPKINTSYDEESPFIHLDAKTLYFSSKGHNSMGGFDLFDTKVDPRTGLVVAPTENLGYPINTFADETFISWSADGLRAYFSSVREGGMGEEDIYLLTRPKEEEASHVVIFRGRIKDAVSKSPIGATITVVDDETEKVVATFTANSSTGKFLFVLEPGKNYAIEVEAPKHMFHSENINIPESKGFQMITDSILLEVPKPGHKVALFNIFFEDHTSKLKLDSHYELTKIVNLLTNHKSMKIQITGHVFTEKDVESNMKLSEERAKTVIDYLKGKGIVATKLSSKPMGNTSPLPEGVIGDNTRIELEVK
jgi:outer membrane protein OmpA-like peptidoglycan-associated protein